jgi:agmatinase
MAATSIDNAFTARQLAGASYEPTYAGALSFMRRKYSKSVKGADAVVWGIPFDAAVTNRPGARFGPQAIRRASAIMDNDRNIRSTRPVLDLLRWSTTATACSTRQPPEDAGHHRARGEKADPRRRVPAVARRRPFRHLAAAQGACRKIHGPLALVQFDAHQDTWDDDGKRIDHGSFVRARCARASSIPTARSRSASAPTRRPIAASRSSTVTTSRRCAPPTSPMRSTERTGGRKTYVTFDIDCLDPAFAPGTGTPVAGGPSSAKMLSVLRQLDQLDIVGADVVEVAPAYDHADITADRRLDGGACIISACWRTSAPKSAAEELNPIHRALH